MDGTGEYEERENRILSATGFSPSRGISAISRLVLRKDGFTSVHSDYRGGEFRTPELVFQGNRLVLNVDTAAAGILRIGLMDPSGGYYKGFSISDFKTIHTCNDCYKTAEWTNGSDVTDVAGKPVRLHFQMADTHLYAFQFAETHAI